MTDIKQLRKDLHLFFFDLDFNEGKHTYFLGDKYLPSVSKKIKKFYPKFDADAISKRKAEREGLDAEDLKRQWNDKRDSSATKGTKIHNFGELYPFNRRIKPKNEYEKAVVKFWNDLPDHIVVVTVELRMYHKDYMFAGTTDIVLYDMKNNCFILADYKTNEDLFKNFAGQRMLRAFGSLLDTPYNHYQIQLSYYQMMLEQFGIPVSERIIIWLLPDGTYKMYETSDFRDILKKYEK